MVTLLLLVLTLTFEPGMGCTRGQAVVEFVQPDVVKILYVEDCGAIRCWSQWLQINAQRAGYSRVCQDPTSGRLVPESAR